MNKQQMIQELLDGFGLGILDYDYSEVQDAIQYLSFMDQRALNELILEQLDQ